MKNHQNMMFDPKKTFSPEVTRTNLLLASLYLTAFELLKISIIEGLKDFFIVQDEITPENEQIMVENLDKCIRQPFVEQGHGRLMMSITPLFEFMEPLGGAQICSSFA